MSRRTTGVVVGLLAALLCGSASGAVRADWQVSILRPAGTLRATKQFVVIVQVAPTDENRDSYNTDMTLTPSRGLRIVSWTSSVSGSLRCARVGTAVQCSQRSIGDLVRISTAIVILRAAKAGRYSLSAKIVIADDTDPANDTAKRTFAVRPAPRTR